VFILLSIIAFIIVTFALFAFRHAGYVYLVVVLTFGLTWLARASTGFTTTDDALWARRLFLYSLVVLVAFSIGLVLGPVLP